MQKIQFPAAAAAAAVVIHLTSFAENNPAPVATAAAALLAAQGLMDGPESVASSAVKTAIDTGATLIGASLHMSHKVVQVSADDLRVVHRLETSGL